PRSEPAMNTSREPTKPAPFPACGVSRKTDPHAPGAQLIAANEPSDIQTAGNILACPIIKRGKREETIAAQISERAGDHYAPAAIQSHRIDETVGLKAEWMNDARKLIVGLVHKTGVQNTVREQAGDAHSPHGIEP